MSFNLNLLLLLSQRAHISYIKTILISSNYHLLSLTRELVLQVLLVCLSYIAFDMLDVPSRNCDVAVADELLSLNYIFGGLVVPRNLRDPEIMALYIKVMFCEEPFQV